MKMAVAILLVLALTACGGGARCSIVTPGFPLCGI